MIDLDALLEVSPDGAFVVLEDGTIAALNERACMRSCKRAEAA